MLSGAVRGDPEKVREKKVLLQKADGVGYFGLWTYFRTEGSRHRQQQRRGTISKKKRKR